LMKTFESGINQEAFVSAFSLEEEDAEYPW
jgi:hypothetical protein